MARTKIPIPPVNGGCGLMIICVPENWAKIIAGSIHRLCYGYQYNHTTGDIAQAITTANEIYESLCYMSCEELTVFKHILMHMDARLGGQHLMSEADYTANVEAVNDGYSVKVGSNLYYDGYITDMSLTEILTEALFAPASGLSKALYTNDGYKGLADIAKKLETTMRHLEAKFGRTGVVLNELADGDPWVDWPWAVPNGMSLTGTFSSPSAFTYDRAWTIEQDWLAGIVFEALRAGVRPGINIPGLGDIGGTKGIPVADLFKGPEPSKSYGTSTLGIRKEGGVWYAYAGGSEWQIHPLDTYAPEGQTFHEMVDKGLIEGDVPLLKTIGEKLSATQRTVVEAIDEIDTSSGLSFATMELALADIATAIQGLEAASLSQTQQQDMVNEITAAMKAIEVVAIAAADNSCVSYKSVDTGCSGVAEGIATGGELNTISEDGDLLYYDSEDCQWVDYLVDALIFILEWVLYGIAYIGLDAFLDKHNAAIIARLMRFRWFTRAVAVVNITIGAGPDPTDIATIGVAILTELIVQLAQEAADISVPQIIENLQQNREAISDYLCNNMGLAPAALAAGTVGYFGSRTLLGGAAKPLKELIELGVRSRQKVRNKAAQLMDT